MDFFAPAFFLAAFMLSTRLGDDRPCFFAAVRALVFCAGVRCLTGFAGRFFS